MIPPPSAVVAPRLAVAWFIVLRLSAVTAAALWASTLSGAVWVVGQLVLAACLVQWFIVLHECGHGTLFPGRTGNVLAGHVASVFALIPFHSWQSVHHQHHKWTGWQDRDPTTMVLTPRERPQWYLRAVGFCWRAWIPVFALFYRLGNYWNPKRLSLLFPRPVHRRRHTLNIVLLLALYVGLMVLGWGRVLGTVGLALLISNQILDVLLLSQHSHIPMKLAGDERVEHFSYAEQTQYTRSLRFPPLVSQHWLLGFDLHALHHELPRVPGYSLADFDREYDGDVHWLAWTLRAKSTPARVFLYTNRNESGLTL